MTTSSKIIPFRHFKKMLFESIANEKLPIKKIGSVIRLDTCDKQKEMSFGYDGFVFAHKDVNPKLSDKKPYIIIIKNDENWEMHFRNFVQGQTTPEQKDDLYHAISKSFPSGFTINARGGCSPGGLSGISKLSKYGFKKQYVNERIYWESVFNKDYPEYGGIDLEQFNEWINNPKHFDEFVVIQDDGTEVSPKEFNGEKTIENTKPKAFDMVKT